MPRIESGRKSRAGASLPTIPDKLYFRIGEVARLLALPAYVLRFWESEFPQLKPGKGGTGQRLYRRADLDMLLEIRRLLYDQGYTIPGARQFLKEQAQLQRAQLQSAAPTSISETSESAATMLQLRSELRELARMLAEPVAGVNRNNPAHRGLHLASKKRVQPESPHTLFAMHHDTPQNDPAK